MMGCSKDKAEVQDNNKPNLTSQENIYSRNNVGNNRAETEQSNYPAFNEINNNNINPSRNNIITLEQNQPRENNMIIQDEDANQYNNHLRRFPQLPPIQPPIQPPIDLNRAPVPQIEPANEEEEENSFECKLSKDDLSKKIEEFIHETRDQDKFYKILSPVDETYNQLIKKEEEILKNIFNSDKDNFLEQIKEQYNQIFEQDFGYFDYKSLTEAIINNENGQFHLTNKIRKNILEIEKNVENFSVKHITILLVGKSGVGKSTLCNNLLRLPENKKALVDIGKPVTQKSNIYSDPKVSFLKIIDTAGIEIHGQNKIENVIQNCKETIDTQVNSKDKNDMVSCIFYCFTGSRIEDEEVEFLDELRKSLKGNEIPILYVYTQAVRQSAINGMKECIEKEKTWLGEVKFVPVLAEDFDLIDDKWLKSYGLDIILEKAVETIKNNIKSNLFEVSTKEISDEIKEYFMKKNEKIKNYSKEQMYMHYVTNFNEVMDKEQLIKFLLEIIEKCFIFFIEPKEVKNLGKNSISEYKNNFQNYIEQCYNLFDETCSNILDSFKEKQAGRFLNEQAKLEKLGINILSENKRELDDFIKIIDEYFRRNFIYIAERDFIKFIINKIYEKICKYNEEYCNEIIEELIAEEKSIKEAINKCFITKYMNIEKNIADYKNGYQQNIYGRNYV